jgi:hypothetical protein
MARWKNLRLGIGVGYGGAPEEWTPDDAPGIFEWYIAVDDPAVLVPCAQPVIVNGNFETGDTSGWTVYGSAVLSADATTPYEGSYCGKSTGAAYPDGFYRSNADGLGQIIGNLYRLTGVAAGDGTVAPRVVIDGSAVNWDGTSSAAWQTISAQYTCATASYGLLLPQATTAAGFVRFDSIVMVNDSRSKWYAQDGVNFVANATAAEQPWQSTAGGKVTVYHDTGDASASGRAAAEWTFLHYVAGGTYDAPVFTATVPVNIPTLAGTHTIFSTGTTTDGCHVYVDATGAVVVAIIGATGAIHPACASAGGVITNGATALVTVTADGTDIIVRVDGVQVKTVAFDASAANSAPDHALILGADTGPANALVGHVLGAGFSTECLAGVNLTKWEAFWSAI